MLNRRRLLAQSGRVAALLATAGLLPPAAQAAYNAAAFEAKTLAELARLLDGAAPVESKDVVLAGPDVADNGAAVPIDLSTTVPGVKRLMLLVEKNPNLLSAMFEPGDVVEPAFSIRIKMSQSSNVFVVAMTADGRTLFAQKDIKVTIGGCG